MGRGLHLSALARGMHPASADHDQLGGFETSAACETFATAGPGSWRSPHLSLVCDSRAQHFPCRTKSVTLVWKSTFPRDSLPSRLESLDRRLTRSRTAEASLASSSRSSCRECSIGGSRICSRSNPSRPPHSPLPASESTRPSWARENPRSLRPRRRILRGLPSWDSVDVRANVCSPRQLECANSRRLRTTHRQVRFLILSLGSDLADP